MKKGTNRRVWQIRVDLEDVWPPVWRRILVPDTAGLLRLHQVIQAAFGWWDYHLHEFRIHGAMYGDPASDEFGEFDILDEEWVKLRDLELAEGESFSYVYDFGDDWRHRLRLEKIRPPEKRERLPRCVDGRRACPPEDAGGPGGYQELLLALGDPEDSEHERYLEWVGGSFDPDAFDPDALNRALHGG